MLDAVPVWCLRLGLLALLLCGWVALGCGDPVGPVNFVNSQLTIDNWGLHRGRIPCWTGDARRDTIWITPAEVWGIECYCTLPVGVDPADYRPVEP